MTTRTSYQFLLSPTSGVPLYRQLMDQLRAEVMAGRLVAGTMLPSVRQVAQELQINPMTVSKAYSHLESDGLLERVRGQGMRVLEADGDDGWQARRERLLPLMEKLVDQAGELGLSRGELLTLLDPLLKELNHD